MIRPNKKYAFDLPSLNHEKRSLVRTGTYPDGNCFIHALLRAIDNAYRKQDSQAMHVHLVGEFRKKIYDWITPEVFYSLGNGVQLKLYFSSELNHLLDQQYAKTHEVESIYHIVQHLVPRTYIDQVIIPNIQHEENFYSAFLKKAELHIRTQLRGYDEEKTRAVCNLMSKYFIDLFQEAHQLAYQNFRNKMRTMNEYVDSFQMECISKFVNYNFLFVDNNTSDVYQGLSHVVSFDHSRDCVLFLWVNENHFEVLGVLEHGNIINRVFKSNDPLIRRIYQKLTNLDSSSLIEDDDDN